MATFNNIGGAEPSTVTFRLGTVTHDRGSTTEHQEIIVLGSPDTSNALAAVLDTTPASTAWALAVREVAPSTTVEVSNFSTTVAVSTGSVRVHQSSAGDLNVTVAGYVAPSTVVTVSTGSVRVHQSTAADLNVTVAGYVAPSTIVTVSTGSVRVHQSSAADLQVTATLGTNLQSTAAPSSGSSGLVVRPVLDDVLTFVSTNAFASTSATIASSVATQRGCVFAYSITSTVTTPVTAKFYAGTTLVWSVVLQAGSSVISGANLAVSPPAYLFRSDEAGGLTVQTASSVSGVKVSASYFRSRA